MMEKINNNHLMIGKAFIESNNSQLYLREISKLSKLDVKTIFNEVKILLKYNILDFKERGRLKFYFLKDTIESRLFLEMAENYRTFNFLFENKLLKLKLEKLSAITNFVIFGSYANSTKDKNSDLDIVIFTSKENKKIVEILNEFNIKTHIHYIRFRSFSSLVKKGHTLGTEILKNHILFGKNKYFIPLLFLKG